MLGSRSGALLGLVVALFIFEDQLRLTWLHKLAVLCCGWLIMGGWETLYIVIRTLPRDLTAVYKMVQLVGGTKWAEYRNLTVPKIFSATVARCPNKVLFYFGEEEWTFQQVEDYSNRVGHFFLQEGYGKGDTVAVFMENRPEFVCTWLGLAKIGVVPALINYNLRAESLHHSISVAGCKALVYSKHLEQFVSEVFSLLINGTRVSYPTFVTGREGGEKGGRSSGEKVPGSRDLDQLCLSQPSQPVPRSVQESINFTDKLLYIYTSGTTGLPKAAVIKHARYILASRGLTAIIGVRRGDVLYCPLPLYHSVGGMISLSGCISSGISMVIRDKFSASQYWSDCIRYKVTVAQYIGEMCRYLINSPASPQDTQHHVRLMFGNGLRADIWRDFVQRFNIPNISEFYGSTEGNSNIINYDNTVGAVGFVPVLFSSIMPLGLIRVDEEGIPVRDPRTGLCIRCPVGEPGEFVGVIQTNHPVREFSGYSDSASTNKKILSNVWKQGDICFRSGDILVCDKFGYYYFKDRKGDTFRWKGENVSTAEVESVVSRLTGHCDVVVYGVRVPGCEGRVGMAAIASCEELDLEDLAQGIVKKLPNYARPFFVRLSSQLDMTGTFKLKKRDLQAQGFGPDIEDDLYFLDMKEKKYVPLTSELREKINSGETSYVMISKIKSLMTSFNIVQPRSGQKTSFCQLMRDLTENRKLVYFAEIHSQPAIINLQLAVLQSLTDHVHSRQSKVHVFLEHFSINDQSLIDEYINNPSISEEDLDKKYHELSEEGHDISQYFPIFQFAKENINTITLNGSFIPRHFAKQLVREGEETAYNSAIDSGYLEEKDRMVGSEAHYNYFESLISGRDVSSGQAPGENFRRIFPAQVLKDCAMAGRIRRGLESSAEDDKLLVIAGLGHLEYRLGVPERVDRHDILSQEKAAIITVRDIADLPSQEHLQDLGRIDQFDFSYPGDYILLYEDPPEADDVKEEISAAYDRVAQTANIEGDLQLAKKVMARLGYSASMIAEAGTDAYNYQGVGCPHNQAEISEGQSVLDLGSGLGVDSFIAASLVGTSGRVTGLDFSRKEVEHAAARASARNVKNLDFVHGDMEKMPFSDGQFDVVISNGAFCLASDKAAAFREIQRVLKPGGRFSVACTTTRVPLDTDINWPVCMRVFMPLEAAQPMLEEIGFRNVSVDDSDSKMTFEEEDLNVDTDSNRYKIHGNSEEFKHLENFDMNSLCARVVLLGFK